MTEVSDDPGESQSETPNATPQRPLVDQSLPGAPEPVLEQSLCPEIVIHVEHDVRLGKTEQDQPPPFTVRIEPPAGS